jgi:hypothetical protein
MFHRTIVFGSLLTLMLVGCGSDSESDPGTGGSGGDAGAAGTGGGTAGSSGDAGNGGTGGSSNFDPSNPGVRLEFNIGVALMMGQPATFAAGAFLVTGREDLDPVADSHDVPLETCQETEVVYTPSCSGPQDCAAEQQCVPETDMDGNAIANSEHCETPRTPLDMGQFTMEGFATGSKTMAYNAGQNGAYTTPGGDGTIPYEDLAFDTTYTFQGAGDASQGLGAFSGELYLSSEIKLTQPEMTTLPMGFDGIQISVDQDLVMQWDGSDPGAELTITLTGATMSGESHTITCRTADAGSFTIPAAMVQAAQLGDMAFLNMLTFERKNSGTVSGDGLTSHDIGTLQTAVINVAKAQ